MTVVTLDAVILEIVPEERPENPRDWDNLGAMACWHRRYALGDRHGYRDPAAFRRQVHSGNAVILPLYLLDHSGLTVSTDPARFRACDPYGWDWGPVGYVYATLAKVYATFGVRRVTRDMRARIEACLRDEVAVYDQYLRGEVFCFALTERASDAVLASCGGFYGGDPVANGMAEYFPPEHRDALVARLCNR